MLKYWCLVLAALLTIALFSGCKKETPTPATEQTSTTPHTTTGDAISPAEGTDPLSAIMQAPGDRPQLTKEEFVEIIHNYLTTNLLEVPPEKISFGTYGFNYYAVIVQNSYMFEVKTVVNADDSADYTLALSYYVDGIRTMTINDPLLFEEFIK